MYIKSSYTKLTEDRIDKFEKKNNWEVAIGLNEVDNLKPSKYLIQLMEDSIEGKKTYKEVENALYSYYKELDPNDKVIIQTEECDLVSVRIVQLLENGSFKFSPITLKGIHRALFKDLFKGELEKSVGEFRDYNISKKELILGGDSVMYGDYNDLMDILAYDFKEESKKSANVSVSRLARFISSIWQVHPFCEGNTITTAVFIIKYLRSLGYNLNNDLFKKNSLYFRNALVLSNYSDVNRNIRPDFKYLESFFEKLLIDTKIELEQMK
ncbi:Fic family protein (plasmid) [Paraclostridium benzoelyticum]|uniref:Fic family protein n=1 Tax=Paraclostridium benzoelyticum TaxID=1629550 RepID=UPI0031CD7280